MEPKFRYWDQFNGVMVYSDHFPELCLFFDEYYKSKAGENEPVLMMAPGKKDVENNIELYESDVIFAHRFYFDGMGESEQEIKAIIKWDSGHCAFMIGDIRDEGKEDQLYFLLSEFDFSDETAFTQLGNIYENTELLK